MPLTCSCSEDYDWYYFGPDDFTSLQTKRGRRCCSCKRQIQTGSIVGQFNCYRYPRNDIEERIYGDEVPMAPKFMCEECCGLYFSLTELGFCIELGTEPMRDLVREYADAYGRKAA